MKAITLGAMVVFLFFVEPAQATSFAPYAEQCIADSNGQYYVVVKRKDDGKQTFPYGPVSLTIAERRAGSAPVRSAMAGEGTACGTFLATVDPAIRVRDGDIVHGRIDLDQPPGVVLVSSTGKGIVTLDKYGFNGLGPKAGIDDLVIYSLNGKVLHRKDRSALFDAKARQHFCGGDGCLTWLDSSWLDEKRAHIVIVGVRRGEKATSRPVLIVTLSSGEVRPGSTELIDRAISERNPNALSQALDLARSMKLPASKAAWPAILADEKLTLYTRLQVAVLLASFGDQRGAKLIKKTVLDKPSDADTAAQYFAVEKLPYVFGDKAAPYLCAYIRRWGEKVTHHALSAMHAVSAKAAVPELCRLLVRTEPVHCQLFALECLGNKGPAAKTAIPDMIRILTDEPLVQDVGWTKFSTHEYAAHALGRIGPDAEDALPILIRHAEKSAPAEWARVKNQQPKAEPDHFGGIQYSENRFVDAVCKIRKKPDKQ